MRTTIELSETHRNILHALALKRGWRGYSKIIQEAITFYLNHKERTKDEKREILKLKGAFKEKEIEEMKKGIAEVRKNWMR